MPTRRTLAGWPARGSMWRLAEGQHGSDQVVQRPGQVVPGDQGNLVTDAKMADRPTWNRAVGRQGGQGTCQEFLPWACVAGRGGVNHPAPHGAVRADQGHDDPHQLSLSPPAAFRQADHDDAGLPVRRQARRLADYRKRDRARPQPAAVAADPAHRGREGPPG